MVAGAEEGRDRLRRRPDADAVQVAEGRQAGITRSPPSTPASTSWPSTPARRPTDGKPDRRRQPGPEGQAGPPGDRRTRSTTRRSVDKVLRRLRRRSATSIIPPIYADYALRPGRDQRTLRPGQGQPDAGRRPATRRAPDGIRGRRRTASRCSLRLFGRDRQPETRRTTALHPGLAQGRRHRGPTSRSCPRTS